MTNCNEDVSELGAVSVETNGLAMVGPIEAQNGTYYQLGGIQKED